MDNEEKITLWIGKELKYAAKAVKINLSAFLREKLKEELAKRNMEVKLDEPELILEVRCPYCGFKQQTSTIKTVQCQRCKKFFKVYTRKYGSRITNIIKGDKQKLFALYSRVFRKSIMV